MSQTNTLFRPSYEPEVDGLRAFAVIAVILFHAGFHSLEGGFVGVDIFFVISGYLIGTIVTRSAALGTFRFGVFYERRIRRIIPPLLLTLVATLPFAWAWMMPEPFQNFGQSVVAATLSAANILFHLTVGYFDPGVDFKPLVHTWSLGVEEQFYVLFPIIVWAVYKLGAARAMWVTLVAAWVLSFTYAVIESQQSGQPSFFLPMQRFWELLTGVLLAGCAPGLRQHLHQQSSIIRNVLASIAAIGLVACVVLLDRSFAWPGPWSLVPVLLSAIAILSFQGTHVGQFFSNTVVVKIGLISYGLYLFHYPVMALARVRLLEAPSPWLLLLLMVPTTVVAWLSYRYFETPCRKAERVSYPRLLVGSGVVALGLVVVGVGAHVTGGFTSRMDDTEARILAHKRESPEVLDRIRTESGPIKMQMKRVATSDGQGSIAVLGDSHAAALARGLRDYARDVGAGALHIELRGCLRIPTLVFDTMSARRVEECQAFFAGPMKRALLEQGVQVLIVALRWSYHLWPISGEIDRWSFDNGEGGRESSIRPKETYAVTTVGTRSQRAADKAHAVAQYLDWLNQLGIEVIVMEPVPEVGWDVPETMVKRRRYGASLPITTAFDAYLNRNAWALDQLAGVETLSRVHGFETARVLCDTSPGGRCVAQQGDTPLYHDDDHLHGIGVDQVFEAMAPLIRRLMADSSGQAQPARP